MGTSTAPTIQQTEEEESGPAHMGDDHHYGSMARVSPHMGGPKQQSTRQRPEHEIHQGTRNITP
jgi:hypothetical protein